MGSVMNGMAVSGTVPAGGTFFVFSDYMRPAARLASLSGYKTAFVWTHDSVGLGEDGPTHQPIEQLASLRAMPNLRLIRPADANEVSQAWRIHIDGDGPTAFVLSRQKFPVLAEHRRARADGVPKGAYTLVDEADADDLDLVLIGTGSEVSVCVAARGAVGGRRARRCASCRCRRGTSSPPSPISTASRCSRGDVPTLAVEAAATFGWERWADDAVGIDRFGASAPGPTVLAELGFTPENVAAHARCAARERRLRMTSAIARLNDFGQSPWYDNLARVHCSPAAGWPSW